MLAICGALFVVSCGEASDQPASQTAAKVNGEEITVHQVNSALQRATGGHVPQGANIDAASKRVLEGLINQTLLVQQAKRAKLDRDPQVLQLLEAVRRQVLAQAYIARQAAATPPTQDDIKAFYAKNPDLFEKRRIYSFREFLFERAKFTDDIRKLLNGAKSPADIAKVLHANNIRYRETNSTRPAEALPIAALPRIAKLAKGDSLAFTDNNLANVLLLLDYSEQPVTLERATPMIQRYLLNQKAREITVTKVKELRAAGKIEYVGHFAKGGGDAAATIENPEGTPFDEPTKDEAIEKGVQGLPR